MTPSSSDPSFLEGIWLHEKYLHVYVSVFVALPPINLIDFSDGCGTMMTGPLHSYTDWPSALRSLSLLFSSIGVPLMRTMRSSAAPVWISLKGPSYGGRNQWPQSFLLWSALSTTESLIELPGAPKLGFLREACSGSQGSTSKELWNSAKVNG